MYKLRFPKLFVKRNFVLNRHNLKYKLTNLNVSMCLLVAVRSVGNSNLCILRKINKYHSEAEDR